MASEKLALETLLHLRGGLLTLDRDVVSRLVLIVVVPLLTLFAWSVVAWATSPLRKYPGPFLAGFTNLWRYNLTKSGHYGETIKKLHEKYGPVVRIAPNVLDLDYPELIKIIYGTDGKWVKSDMYYNNCTIVDGKRNYNVFSTADQVEHAHMKRPIVKYFTIGSVLTLEPHMDKVIHDFLDHLDNWFISGTPKDFELGDWIQFFTWDALSQVTFSRRYGYMQTGYDHDGTLSLQDKTIDYFAQMSQMPWLDYLLDKNPIVRLGPPYMDNGLRIATEALRARLEGKDESYDPDHPDYLQHFIEAKDTHPEYVSDRTILAYLIVNILAGADTTAITLMAVLYYVLKDKNTYQKLMREVRQLGFDKDEIIPYNKARQLPFLEACVREGMRLNPVVGLALERVVPASGLVLPDGTVVPPGTSVGSNALVVGRNEGVYGPDAQEFRAERWLRYDGDGDSSSSESEQAYRARLSKMNAADLTFGGGSRICLGRHLAMLEVYKILATFANRYEMELSNPDAEWVVDQGWFVKPRSLRTRFTLRK